MHRIRTSWRLFVQSLRLIRQHPALLLFHIVLATLTLLEALLGFIGINIGFTVALAAVLLLGLGIAGAVFWHLGLLLLLVPLLVLAVLVIAMLGTLANQVYRGALYIYATEGVLPGPYDAEDMDKAWKLKAARTMARRS